MANYYGQARTNYFRVKDAEAFIAEMSKLPVEVITHEDKEAGDTFYGFMDSNQDGAGLSWSTWDDETDEDTEINWIDILQRHVAPGWSAILMEVGSEKYRYFNAYAVVVTESGYKELNLESLAGDIARDELGADNVTGVGY
jgi:hypothetical protein